MPTLNIKGHEKVKTNLGAAFSIMIMTLTLLFALVKLDQLALKKIVNITTNTESLDASHTFDTTAEEFMIAVAITSGSFRKSIDPSQFTWYLKTIRKDEAGRKAENYPMSICTDE